MKGDFDMIKELTEKDFARGIKNPYFDKLMIRTEIAVRKKDYELFEELGKPYGVPNLHSIFLTLLYNTNKKINIIKRKCSHEYISYQHR